MLIAVLVLMLFGYFLYYMLAQLSVVVAGVVSLVLLVSALTLVGSYFYNLNEEDDDEVF
jgi:hypothetical protein